MWGAPINGQIIPVRIWVGMTEGGVPIEAYVLSIVPIDGEHTERLAMEIPDFMVKSRQAYQIAEFEKEDPGIVADEDRDNAKGRFRGGL